MSSVSGVNQYPNPTLQIDQYVASALSGGQSTSPSGSSSQSLSPTQQIDQYVANSVGGSSGQATSSSVSGLLQPIQQAVGSLGGPGGKAAEGFLNTYL